MRALRGGVPGEEQERGAPSRDRHGAQGHGARRRGPELAVLHSLFEEQIERESAHLDRYLSDGAESHAEALGYFPDIYDYNLGPDGYLEHLRRAKAAVGIPVIASLNGVSTGGWIPGSCSRRAPTPRCREA